MSEKTLKYVLTGGPNTGKTTLIKSFKKIGYQTVQEAATILLEKELKKEKTTIWDDLTKFQRKLLFIQLNLESKLKQSPATFIDRGIPDGLAYCIYYKIDPPRELIKKIKTHRYDKVFILDFLPFYKIKNTTLESFDEAIKIHELIRNTYEEFGYKLINVPALNVQERIKFIEKNISENYIQTKYQENM